MRPGRAVLARVVGAGLAGAVVAGGVATAGLALTADDRTAPAADALPGRHEQGSAVTPAVARPEDVNPVADRTAAATDAAVGSVAEPVSVALPRLGIESALDPLSLQPDGELEAPPRWDVAGWYVGGPRPGQRGPAVVAGHVDGPDGPAVFWRLREVRAGDRIEVGRADGSTGVFAVTRTRAVPKSGFPTGEVYGPVPHAELRLITCTGPFDRRSGHYVDNLVVFATEVSP